MKTTTTIFEYDDEGRVVKQIVTTTEDAPPFFTPNGWPAVYPTRPYDKWTPLWWAQNRTWYL